MKKILFLIILIALFFGNIQAQNWNEIIKTDASDRGVDDKFGYSVSISGNYAIVGAYAEDEDAAGLNTVSEAGSVYIFEMNTGGVWIEVQKLVASDRGTFDRFGESVSISGNYAIVGAYAEGEDAAGLNTLSQAGSAYVFERNVGGTWIEVQKLVASDRGASDWFGRHVAISGNYVIVGASREDEDAAGLNTLISTGSAYVFERNAGGTWIEVQKLVALVREAYDLFGCSVAISGDYAIVGAYQEDEDAAGLNTVSGAGSVYIFERNVGGTWVEVQKLAASDRGAYDDFGISVAISGAYAIVGAHREDEDIAGLNTMNVSGSAYVFERNVGGTWVEVEKLVASDRGADDYFGCSVAISGTYATVGAFWEDEDATGLNAVTDAGSAYVFERNAGGIWNEVEKLVTSDRGFADNFGNTVAISGTYVLVGAHREDEDAAGLNTLAEAGSAYVFELCSTNSSFGATACGSYTVPSNDETYTTVGTYSVMDTIANTAGCDSLMTINLTILPALTGTVTNTICTIDSVIVNGTVYNASNLNGIEVFTNIGPNNCDSTVTINLNMKTGSVTNTICTIDSVIVNGTVYNAANPTGIEVFSNVGPNNCDSTVTINLNMKTGSVTNTICTYDSIVVNGTTYNASNQSGIEVFTNIGLNNCDSTVTINLNVLPALAGNVTNTICNNDSLVINGTTYNGANSTGTEVFTNVGPYNCDSTVTINLNVLLALTGSVTNTICNEDSVIVNGTLYNASNLSGIEVFTGIGTNSCDSTVAVNLTITNLEANYTITNNGSGNYSFNNVSTSSFNQSHWAFGDGTTSTLTNTNHTFNADGAYIVVLTINDSTTITSCIDYFIDTIIVTGVINPTQCTAGFAVIPDTINGGLSIVNSSTGSNISYLWGFGDGSTSTLPNPSHTYTNSGPFNLCLTVNDGNGCNDMYCDSIGANGVLFRGAAGFTIKVITPPNSTSISEGKLDSDIKIYPNPSRGIFTVGVGSLDLSVNITVYSVLGQQIINKRITSKQTIIDLSSYDKGIYIVKIKNGDKIHAERIVKQ